VLLYSSLSLLQKRKDLKPILGVKSSSILRSQRKNPPASLIVECKVQGISNDAQNVSPDNKIYCKKVKMCQEIGFSAPNSCSLPWLVNGPTQLCTSKNECNKLDVTEAQYF